MGLTSYSKCLLVIKSRKDFNPVLHFIKHELELICVFGNVLKEKIVKPPYPVEILTLIIYHLVEEQRGQVAECFI